MLVCAMLGRSVVALVLVCTHMTGCHVTPPNVLFLLADDLGWNDVGWHNPDMRTPHLDRLAREGVVLEQHYVEPVCSPSRAALLTGKYPFTMGMQHGTVKMDKPQGLPVTEQILPQLLQRLGYATHIVGKWHLGFCRWEYTPTWRGFDSFQGFYLGGQDYYTKTNAKYHRLGYDYRFNTEVYRPKKNQYSTLEFAQRAETIIKNKEPDKPLFIYLPFQSVHLPLQVPRRVERQFMHVRDARRRVYSAMVTALDHAVGHVMSSLRAAGQENNTLVIFTSDNGGAPNQGGNNWPLRGGKSTVWEGGTRVPALVWGSMLEKRGYVSKQMMHVTDWLPTILDAVTQNTAQPNKHPNNQPHSQPHRDTHNQPDLHPHRHPHSEPHNNPHSQPDMLPHRHPYMQPDTQPHSHPHSQPNTQPHSYPHSEPNTQPDPLLGEISGVSQWGALNGREMAPRHEFVYAINEISGRAAFRWKQFKLIEGDPGRFSDWYAPAFWQGRNVLSTSKQPKPGTQRNLKSTLLFDLINDPIEFRNLAAEMPDLVRYLQDKLHKYREKLVSAHNPRDSPRADPTHWGGVWSPGWC